MANLLCKLIGNTKLNYDEETIWIVSGLPRSGTSLMMQMLQAGGLPILTDEARRPDEHNPKGYFELQKVKHLALDSSWLSQSRGKAIKVIVQLIPFLPAGFKYQILFVHRDVREIVRSQERMLQREPLGTKLPEAQSLIPSFEKAFAQAIAFARLHPNTQFEVFEHRQILSHPLDSARQIVAFLGSENADIEAMGRIVDQKLHRNRFAD